MNVKLKNFRANNGLWINHRHGATIGRHSLSHAHSGVPAPSEREPGMGAYHSTDRPETVSVRAIFIAPTKLRVFYRFLTQKRYRVGQGTHRMGTRPKRN